MGLNLNAGNHLLENKDSADGGLVFYENTEVLSMVKDDVIKLMNLPNKDLCIEDVELIPTKPRMPVAKRNKVSRHNILKYHQD
jgi:hypothetical protein